MDLFSRKIKALNRRKETRYTLKNLAAYTEEGADGRERLINVSLSGCCLESQVQLKQGEHILVHFIASSNFYAIDDSFCLDGCVKWGTENENGGFEYGLEFAPARSPFFLSETQAFREEVARLACQVHLEKGA